MPKKEQHYLTVDISTSSEILTHTRPQKHDAISPKVFAILCAVVLRVPCYFRSPFVRDIPSYPYTASLYISESRLSFERFYTAYRYDNFRTVYYSRLRLVLCFVSYFFSCFVSLRKFRNRSLLLKIFKLAFL